MEANQYPLFAPGDILDIEDISEREIILFMVLFGMMRLEGYCWATNEYLCNRLKWCERKLQKSMKILHGANLIRIEVDGPKRKIYPIKYHAYPAQLDGVTPHDHTGYDDSSIFLINKHNKITETKISKSKFEEQIGELYKNYPLKKGKTVGVKKLVKEIKTEEQLKKLETAIKNYSLECKGSDPKYIKHFSTFAGCWQDYLEAPTRKSSWAAVKLVDGKFVSADEQDQSEEP